MTTRQEVSQEICFLGSNKREPPLRIWEAHNNKNMSRIQLHKSIQHVTTANGKLSDKTITLINIMAKKAYGSK